MTSNVGLNTSLTYIYPIPRLMYKRTSDLVWRHITPHVVVHFSSRQAALAVTGLNRQQSLYISSTHLYTWFGLPTFQYTYNKTAFLIYTFLKLHISSIETPPCLPESLP